MDDEALRYLGLAEGDGVNWKEIKNKVRSTPGEWFSAFCAGCDWEEVCRRARQ